MSQHEPVTVSSRAPRAFRAAALLYTLVALLAVALLAPSSALAIARDEAVARGKVWVDRNVPYSQGAYADESGRIVARGLGYRTDCSGFVSLCWDLRWDDGRPRSLDTAQLAQSWATERIGKADLQPGDILLRPKTAQRGGHAVLFVGWLDPIVKSQYIGYEEKGSEYGTVCSLRIYPENGMDGYYPRRYLGIEEDYLEQIEPVRGYDRFETAVSASRSTFPTGGVEAVVVASGMDWPDALGGAALAGAHEAPVLLTRPDSLPGVVREEIRRLGAKRAYLLGGTPAVSDKVAEALKGVRSGFEVVRLGGKDRYETASLAAAEAVAVAAKRGKPAPDTVFVASGLAFPDALAASPASASGVRPILLARPGGLPAATRTALERLAPSSVVLLGGEPALSSQVAEETEGVEGLPAGAAVTRVGGADRYETAAALARWGAGRGLSWAGTGIATGLDFPDALSGGVALGERGSVMLLTRRDVLSPATGRSLRDNAEEVGRATCFGGMSAVSSEVRREIAIILGFEG